MITELKRGRQKGRKAQPAFYWLIRFIFKIAIGLACSLSVSWAQDASSCKLQNDFGPQEIFQSPQKAFEAANDFWQGTGSTSDEDAICKYGGISWKWFLGPAWSLNNPLDQYYAIGVDEVWGFCTQVPDASGKRHLVSTKNITYEPGTYVHVTIHCRLSQSKVVTLTAPEPSQIRPAGTGGVSTLDLTAKVTANGVPQAAVDLTFSLGVTANSGGHDHHSESRPKGGLSKTAAKTDANGEVKLTFTAPEIAGIHTVKAVCATCSNTTASKEVLVKIPDLVKMPLDTKVPPSYTLVGQTTNHTSNHWFLPQSRDTLARVVDTMSNTGWGAVGINDGSLVWGGLFDIKGGWTPSHHEHRTGNEVDISVTNPRLATAAQKKKTYAELCKKDNTALSLQTLWHQDDGYPEHFHMYLDGTGLTSQAGGGPCCARYKTTRAKKDRSGKPVLDKTGNPVQETVALCEETSPR